MSSKPSNQAKPQGPNSPVKQGQKNLPVENKALEQQKKDRISAAAAAGASKSSPPPPPAQPAAPAKPLTTALAAAWPASGQPMPESKPAQLASKASPASAPPKPSAQQTSPASPQRTSASAQPPRPSTPRQVNVAFTLTNPGAKQVAVCGDFNGWSPSAARMQRNNAGQWETTITLAPGEYEYKFLVDGEWLLDPAALKNMPNVFGSLNSLLEVRP